MRASPSSGWFPLSLQVQSLDFDMANDMKSMGTGKIMVEFFSAEIEFKVWKGKGKTSSSIKLSQDILPATFRS